MSNNKNKKNKKKKEKITYVDDGRSIADMSAVGGGGSRGLGRGTLKEQWQTYIRAVRSMLIPMLVTMAGICVIFLILWLLF